MIVNFDYFNRAQDPKLFICNPNNKELAPIPQFDNLDVKPTFNGLSELTLNIYKYIKDKDTGIIDTTRVCSCYKYIENHRQIHVENLGYFIINEFDETNDDTNPYIEVSANSCEIELNNAGLDIADGTYQFYNAITPLNTILGKIIALCSYWTIGTISSTVSARYRTFTDLNQQIYAFMTGDMSTAFECIVDFDIENRIINVLDSNTEIPSTDILLTFDNVIKNIKVNKSSDNIVTSLQVIGSGDLDIRSVNPLGTNVIYQFDYYMTPEWASQDLIDAVNVWKQKIIDNTTNYNNLILQIDIAEIESANLDGQLSDLTVARDALKLLDADAVGQTNYATAHANLLAKQAQVDAKQVEVTAKATEITSLNAQLSALQSSFSLANNFTGTQYNDLCRYIYQSKYTDDSITITNSMTYAQKQTQKQLLYAKSQKILSERCQPTSTITFDCENFLLIPEFEMFRSQLELGRIIHVELEHGNIVDMALLRYEMDYDDKSLKITVSNRLKLHDAYTQAGDLQSQVSTSANTITDSKGSWDYPMKSGILDELDARSKAALNIKNNPLIAADGQHAVFDDTGYHGFKLDTSTGTYSSKQMQITNNVIRFTTDNWNTIKGAFGEFTLANGTVVYGLNGETIVAGKIQSADGKVYLDLNNGVGAFNKLISTVSGAESMSFNIGVYDYSDDSQRNGLFLLDDTTAIFVATEKDSSSSSIKGFDLASGGDVSIRSNANGGSLPSAQAENGLYMSEDSSGNGSVIIKRGRSSGSTYLIESNSVQGRFTHDFSTNYTDFGELKVTSDTMSLERKFSSSNGNWVSIKNGSIRFGTGGVERGSLDSNGWHGNFPDINMPSGETGDCGITRSDGSTRILHFTDGILDSFG